MKVVSSQTHTQADRDRADDGFAYAARALAANLMRLAKGGGAAHKFPEQMHHLFEAMESYRDVHTQYPSQWDWERALDPDTALGELRPSTIDDGNTPADLDTGDKLALEGRRTLRDIRSGALQMAASMLLKQVPQQSAGESQLFSGFWERRAVREKSEAHYSKLSTKDVAGSAEKAGGGDQGEASRQEADQAVAQAGGLSSAKLCWRGA